MSVQERLSLAAIARRLFSTSPDLVVDAIVGITAGTTEDHPMLLLGALQVADETVIDALLGFEAPDEWLGIGVVAGDCAISGARGGADELPPTRVVYLLDRSGDDVTALGFPADEPTLFDHRVDRARGHLVDVCHRCLGLATPPPATPSTARLIGSIWLDRVADAVLAADQWPGWSTIARLHPAVDPFDDVPGPERLSMLADDYVARTSWARARAQVTLGRLHMPGVEPDVVSWMDVGTFARWTERAFIDSTDLLGAMAARFGHLVQPIQFVVGEAYGDSTLAGG